MRKRRNEDGTYGAIDYDAVREELQALAKRGGGRFSLAAVVRAAQKKSSAMHEYFTWDVERAAWQCWLHQAGNLVRKVQFVIKRPAADGKVIDFTVKQFHSLRSQQRHNPQTEDELGASASYESLDTILKEPYKRAELLQMAYDELQSFKRRYEHLEELASVMAAIKEVVPDKEHNNGHKAVKASRGTAKSAKVALGR